MKLECSYYQIPKIVKFLDPSEWVLFTVMFDGWKIMKNEEDWYFRSEKQLSEESGLSTRTIKRTIKKLEEKELILVKRHNDGYKKASYDKANDYKINMEKVVKLASFKGCQVVQEGCQIVPPYNKNINNNNSTIYYNTMENSKNSYDIECSGMEGSQNDRMNERSDNGTTEMNDTIPSTLENTINTMENDPNPAPASQTQNKATGEHQTTEVEQLSKEERIKRQEARKEEIRLFNAGHDKHRYDMCHNIKTSADFDRFNALLQADIDYVNACDWNENSKEIWRKNYDYWISKCEDKIMKNYNRILERENKYINS